MESIRVRDKNFNTYITHDEIQEVIKGLASRINHDLKGKNPLFIVVLNGAFVFAADIYRRLEFDSEITFIKLSSYQGMKSTRSIKEVVGLDRDLTGREVVILEDIIDTGKTMAYAKRKFLDLGAKKVYIATLLFKPDAFEEDYTIDYVGMKIPNDFIVGFGLDYDGHGRHYPDIYKVTD